jgi:peptidoglycan hydrolase CwlO-like protein
MPILKRLGAVQELKNLQVEAKTIQEERQNIQAQLEPLQEKAEKMITELETEKDRMEQVHLESLQVLKEHVTTGSWRPS